MSKEMTQLNEKIMILEEAKKNFTSSINKLNGELDAITVPNNV